jgi:SCF-associated factor 1
VLKGDVGDDNVDLKPKIILGLQNKSVISVVPGDYHYIALTSSGKVLTWGECDKGALGLGDPRTLIPGTPGAYAVEGDLQLPEVKVPTEVRFDHGTKIPKDRFCFSIAAAGWHSGALVIDLEVCFCSLRCSKLNAGSTLARR